jgi:hypothetical protein
MELEGRYWNIHATRRGQKDPDPTPIAQVFAVTRESAVESAQKMLRAQGGRTFNIPRTYAQYATTQSNDRCRLRPAQ